MTKNQCQFKKKLYSFFRADNLELLHQKLDGTFMFSALFNMWIKQDHNNKNSNIETFST